MCAKCSKYPVQKTRKGAGTGWLAINVLQVQNYHENQSANKLVRS